MMPFFSSVFRDQKLLGPGLTIDQLLPRQTCHPQTHSHTPQNPTDLPSYLVWSNA